MDTDSTKVVNSSTSNPISGDTIENIPVEVKSPPEPQKNAEKFKIFFDSSFLVSLIDEKDSNHSHVSGTFNFLKSYSCGFYLYFFVAAEVISKLVHRTKSVPKALQIFKKLEKLLIGSGGYYAGASNWSVEEIISRYKSIQKKQLKLLQLNDFIIATEGVLLGGIILTCDSKMFKKVKPYYRQIYLIAPEASGYSDDIPRLTREFIK
jgi:predicted nucleic acid-binding protein